MDLADKKKTEWNNLPVIPSGFFSVSLLYYFLPSRSVAFFRLCLFSPASPVVRCEFVVVLSSSKALIILWPELFYVCLFFHLLLGFVILLSFLFPRFDGGERRLGVRQRWRTWIRRRCSNGLPWVACLNEEAPLLKDGRLIYFSSSGLGQEELAERDMQLVALEQLCMLLLMSDNVDRCFER